MRFLSAGYPLQFQSVGRSVLLGKGFKRFWNSRFFLVAERKTEDESEPKTVGEDNVMKECSQFVVLSGGLMVTNCPQD